MTGISPDPEFLLTAEEAFPALERMFLDAQDEISGGFRIFDPDTKLRHASDVGETWFDLIAHTLARGVRIRMVLADFDPIAAPALHRMAWCAVRQWRAAAEASGQPDLLDIRAALHPARVGLGSRMLLLPVIQSYLRKERRRLAALPQKERDTAIRDMPGLRPWLESGVLSRPTILPPLHPATHHQKLAVMDRSRLFIGGIDVNNRRYDTLDHARAAKSTWHDVAVIVEGPVVAEACAHLDTFVAVSRGERPPPSHQHLLTTLSQAQPGSPRGLSPRPVVDTLYQATLAEIARADHLIYLETQFFRDQRLARALAEAARAKPDLSLVLILPAAPEDVAFHGSEGPDARYGEHLQAKAVEVVRRAFGPRALIGSPVQPRRKDSDARDTAEGAPLIYVHAKLSIFDNARAIVSSGNLNGRSMEWDTEAGVCLTRRDDVERLSARAYRHWFGQELTAAEMAPAAAARVMADAAVANAARPPEDRDGFIVPYDRRPARRFGWHLPFIPPQMV
ncbi:phospholipase D1/2 [Rubricella aquisinus]|uniref:Phospholipase D n=1 Tax=Rubricella aquisinus TaxID=2028108 RepID=A0A840WWX1_9RHOB|nr:phospholipase D-like domain-containing protein [Rubricella aquisinus]MBB5514195.1 phospholipase D1/2 [Rubricella aquisinus]